MGGGGFQMEPENLLLDDHVLALARERSGRDRPRICLIPTATSDDPALIASFEGLVLGQDAVYVTGGNTANLLALWRLHGLDHILRRAWDAGVVLAGMSAGA